MLKLRKESHTKNIIRFDQCFLAVRIKLGMQGHHDASVLCISIILHWNFFLDDCIMQKYHQMKNSFLEAIIPEKLKCYNFGQKEMTEG